MTVDMICTAPVEYRQRTRAVGDQFEVDERDVMLLRMLNVAVLANGAEETVMLPLAAYAHEVQVVDEPAAEEPVKRKRGRPRKGS